MFANQDCASVQENDTYELFLSINLVILVIQEYRQVFKLDIRENNKGSHL